MIEEFKKYGEWLWMGAEGESQEIFSLSWNWLCLECLGVDRDWCCGGTEMGKEKRVLKWSRGEGKVI
jgi:hypothetical protein